MAADPRPVEPSRIRTALVVLSIGMGLVVMAAWAVMTFTNRAHSGTMFFVVPAIAFAIPMFLSAAQLQAPARGRAFLGATVALIVAMNALILGGLLDVTQWYCWIGAGLITMAVGIVGAMGAGEARFREVKSV